ncbi:hypothetical protein TNCV_2011381 [Trichonephila clavipes]|nr:hypothetical protein TNCV_2011381 [Trichonephila clavipes]
MRIYYQKSNPLSTGFQQQYSQSKSPKVFTPSKALNHNCQCLKIHVCNNLFTCTAGLIAIQNNVPSSLVEIKTDLRMLMLGVTGKRNAKRSSIPYLDSVCGLMWVGLPGRECPDWLVERGKKAWLQNLSFS